MHSRGDGSSRVTIERNLDLLASARRMFDSLGYRIASKGGDGTVGWKEFEPFDGIIVTAGAPSVPEPLLKQLAEGGRLVIPVGGLDVQNLTLCRRRGDTYDRHEIDGFKFVPLIGKMGWK